MKCKKQYYRHGGSSTPQYYCPKCKRAHSKNSKIGKEHFKYARKKSDVKILLEAVECNTKRLLEVSEKALGLIEELEEFHSKTDNNGVPLCYTPRDMYTSLKDFQGRLIDFAHTQDKIVYILELQSKDK